MRDRESRLLMGHWLSPAGLGAILYWEPGGTPDQRRRRQRSGHFRPPVHGGGCGDGWKGPVPDCCRFLLLFSDSVGFITPAPLAVRRLGARGPGDTRNEESTVERSGGGEEHG